MYLPVEESDFFSAYEPLRRMSHGGRNGVLLVRRKTDHALRAVKLFAEEERTAALHEAQILNGLYHPGIPAFYGLVPIRRQDPYGPGHGLVMSFIPGVPLSSAVGTGLAPETAVSYAMQLCEVLTYLHGLPEPILHLDLQPQNILVNEYGRVFLVDFGSSYPLSAAASAPERFGTPHFAAPEIYRPGRLDAGADLYSVGMLLYYMLTGTTANVRFPITLGTCFEEICRTVRDREAGEMLAEIICRLLYPTPLLRCYDAKTLNHRLEQVLNRICVDATGTRRIEVVRQEPKIVNVGICGVSAGIGVTHVALTLNEAFRRKMNEGRIAGNRGECDLHVTDYGVASPDGVRRMCEQTDRQILLAGMQTWQRSAYRAAASMLPDSAIFLFNFGDGKMFRGFVSNLAEPEAKRSLRVPYISDPYYASSDVESFASDVYSMVVRSQLPVENGGKLYR